jgi:hypothetical protein
MTLAKKFFREPGPIDFMIDRRFRVIADSAASLDQPLGKLDVLRDARASRTKLLVKQSDSIKNLPANCHIGSRESPNFAEILSILDKIDGSKFVLRTNKYRIILKVRRHQDGPLHGIERRIPEKFHRYSQPWRCNLHVIVKKRQNFSFGRADSPILSSALPGAGLSDRTKAFSVVVLKAMNDRVDAFLDLVISRIVGDDDFMLDLALTKVF